MKKYTLLIILSLSFIFASSQNCRYKKMKAKDGSPFIRTRISNLSNKGLSSLNFVYLNDLNEDSLKYTFWLQYVHSLSKSVTVDMENQLTFLLSTGDSIVLTPMKNFPYDTDNIYYHISEEEIKLMTKQNCVKISFSRNDENGEEVKEEWRIKDKGQKKLIKNSNCILDSR